MVCLTDFEEYAKEHLSKATWDYYAAGADECCTRDDNLLAYKRYSRARELPHTHILNMQGCLRLTWLGFTDGFLPAEVALIKTK